MDFFFFFFQGTFFFFLWNFWPVPPLISYPAPENVIKPFLFFLWGIETNQFWQSNWFERKKSQALNVFLSNGRGASHEMPVVFRSLEKVTDWPQTQGDSICENTSPVLPSSSFSSLLLNSLICAVFGQRKGSRFLPSCYESIKLLLR